MAISKSCLSYRDAARGINVLKPGKALGYCLGDSMPPSFSVVETLLSLMCHMMQKLLLMEPTAASRSLGSICSPIL